MVFFKTRNIRPYRPQLDHKIKSLSGKDRPDWMSWVYWFYPIINFSFLTPAVVLTAETAAVGPYFLISLNIALSIWNIHKLIDNLIFDEGNRGRHIVSLLILIGAGVIAVQLAMVALPVAMPSASLLAMAFFYANFVSTFVNFASTASQLVLPWAQRKLKSVMASLGKRPMAPTLAPEALKEKSEEGKGYLKHTSTTHDLLPKLEERQLGRKQNDDRAGLNKLDSINFRKRLLSLLYVYQERKSAAFFGPLTEESKIKKMESYIHEICQKGTVTPGSDPAQFFFTRLDKHLDNVSFLLRRHDKIEKAYQGISENQNRTIYFLKTVDKYLEIDHLKTAIAKLEHGQDQHEVDQALTETLVLSKAQKNQPLPSLREIALEILERKMQGYITKMHDEEGLTRGEIEGTLSACLAKFQYSEKDITGMVSVGLKQLDKLLNDRKSCHVTPCTLSFHDCTA